MTRHFLSPHLIFCILALVVILSPVVVSGEIINGEFVTDLTSWDSSWNGNADVNWSSLYEGSAMLYCGARIPNYAYMWQNTTIDSDNISINYTYDEAFYTVPTRFKIIVNGAVVSSTPLDQGGDGFFTADINTTSWLGQMATLKFSMPAINTIGNDYVNYLYVHNISFTGQFLPTNYSNTNTIVLSSTTDYNDTITTSNINNSFYVTTWVNNSLWDGSWSWWGWFIGTDFYIDARYPNGDAHSAYEIWNQNAYQKQYNLSNTKIYGNYTFNIKRYWKDTIFATRTIQIVNDSAEVPLPPLNEIHFSVPSHSNNSDPNINVITSSSLLDANIDVRFQYKNITSGEYEGTNWSLISQDIPYADGYVLGLGQYILDQNYFNNQSVKITANLTNNYVMYTTSDDYIFFYAEVPPTPTPTPTLPPTPFPTIPPTATATPTPFIPDEPEAPITNDTAANVTNKTLENIGNMSSQIGTGISSYNYSTHKTIFGYFLPSLFDMIPAKLWLFIIIGWFLEVSLILLRR